MIINPMVLKPRSVLTSKGIKGYNKKKYKLHLHT